MIPASTAKIFTAVAALDILGPDFSYKTRVARVGEIQNNILNGDIWIVGSGDPSLGLDSADVFKMIYEAIKSEGINQITGKIVVDPHIFPYNHHVLPRDRTWEDMGNYYGAGVFGLNWKGNNYEIYFKPGNEPGDTINGNHVSFNTDGIQFKSYITTATEEEKEDVYLFASPFSGEVSASGKISLKDSILKERGALTNPPSNFGAELVQYLRSQNMPVLDGYTVLRKKKTEVPAYKVFLEINSPPLSELLKEMNQKSNNLYAESIARTVGLVLKADGSAEDACRRIRNYLIEKKLIDDTLFWLRDGSGLSLRNLISACSMTSLLIIAREKPWSLVFEKSLSEAGVSGTLKSFSKAGELKGKTGSLRGIRAYTGYINDASKRQIAFSLVINNFISGDKAIKKQVARIFEALANSKSE